MANYKTKKKEEKRRKKEKNHPLKGTIKLKYYKTGHVVFLPSGEDVNEVLVLLVDCLFNFI